MNEYQWMFEGSQVIVYSMRTNWALLCCSIISKLLSYTIQCVTKACQPTANSHSHTSYIITRVYLVLKYKHPQNPSLYISVRLRNTTESSSALVLYCMNANRKTKKCRWSGNEARLMKKVQANDSYHCMFQTIVITLMTLFFFFANKNHQLKGLFNV